jgi:hypothetical protein
MVRTAFLYYLVRSALDGATLIRRGKVAEFYLPWAGTRAIRS